MVEVCQVCHYAKCATETYFYLYLYLYYYINHYYTDSYTYI